MDTCAPCQPTLWHASSPPACSVLHLSMFISQSTGCTNSFSLLPCTTLNPLACSCAAKALVGGISAYQVLGKVTSGLVCSATLDALTAAAGFSHQATECIGVLAPSLRRCFQPSAPGEEESDRTCKALRSFTKSPGLPKRCWGRVYTHIDGVQHRLGYLQTKAHVVILSCLLKYTPHMCASIDNLMVKFKVKSLPEIQ